MSDEEPAEELGLGSVEAAAVDEEVLLEDLRPQLYRMIYNQPTILFSIFEVLCDLLESRGVMRPGEREEIISEGIRKWRDEVATG